MHLDSLYQSILGRKRPEDVADLVARQLGDRLDRRQRTLLDKAARGSLRRHFHGYTSMAQAFASPVGLGPQVARVHQLFATATIAQIDADDPGQVEGFVRAVGGEIHKAFGASDFRHDRHNAEARDALGITDSRRRYNRKFRLLRRMEQRLLTLTQRLRIWDLTRVGKSSLATRLTRDDVVASEATACFVAYHVARANLRSECTITGQPRAFDEIGAMLLERCRQDPQTRWWVIAHVLPTEEVLGHLTDDEKGRLLAMWLGLLDEIAGLLEATWQRSHFKLATMVVKRGDDSSTWNALAGAWNKARDGWIALVHALHADSLFDAICPGKVMRLMAADLVYVHARAGNGLDPNTAVWAALPLPWQVLRGQAECTRSLIEEACRARGLDPLKTGWTAPRPPPTPVPFKPTPELVHGVTVGNPYLATALRKAGWFSGRTGSVLAIATDEAAPLPTAIVVN